MSAATKLGGRLTFPGTSLTVHRMGYGARCSWQAPSAPWAAERPRMRPSPSSARPSRSGVDHIDTSDYYGPHVTNQIIRKALQPASRGPGDRHQARCDPRRGRLVEDGATSKDDLIAGGPR